MFAEKSALCNEILGRPAALEIFLIKNKPASVFRISHEVFIKGADPLLAEHHLKKREEFSPELAPAFHLQGMMQKKRRPAMIYHVGLLR